MTPRTKIKTRTTFSSDKAFLIPDTGKVRTYDSLYPKSILTEFSNANQQARLHPTQKPVALIDYLIRTYTNPGDVVLDNCMGSGTTGVAALDAARRFIGIERDEAYFAIAKKRIESCDGYMMLA